MTTTQTTEATTTPAQKFHDCGVCKVAKPGAVDWGCVCSMTADEAHAEAVEFARMHD